MFYSLALYTLQNKLTQLRYKLKQTQYKITWQGIFNISLKAKKFAGVLDNIDKNVEFWKPANLKSDWRDKGQFGTLCSLKTIIFIPFCFAEFIVNCAVWLDNVEVFIMLILEKSVLMACYSSKTDHFPVFSLQLMSSWIENSHGNGFSEGAQPLSHLVSLTSHYSIPSWNT